MSFIDQFQQSHNYWDWVPSSCLGLSVYGHQMCIRILSNIAAVTIKDTSVPESNDIISSDGSHWATQTPWWGWVMTGLDPWRVLWCVSVCVLLNVALYSSPHSCSWVSPSSSDILNCNPLMSHKMYWLGNEGTSYTLLTTTLISSGSSAGLASKITHRHFIQRACLSCCNKLWLHSVNFISRIFPN